VQKALGQLVDYVPAWNGIRQQTWSPLLQFVSEKTHGDLFKSGDSETHRLAVTQTKKLSIVYINTDRMNLPIETWAGILAHEALHHLGYIDGTARFPDVLGAEVAKHFKKQMQVSTLEQFNLPSTRTLNFNSVAPGFGTAAFFTNGVHTGDIGWEPTPYQPVCTMNEKVLQQYASAPAWRLNRMRVPEGIVVVRGGGYVTTVCQDSITHQQRTTTVPLDASITLQYPKPLNLQQWSRQVPTPTYGEGGEDSYGPSAAAIDAAFGQEQTFMIESLRHDSTILEAGLTLRTTAILRAIDGYVPTNCRLFIVGTQYSYIGQDRLPGVNPYDSCSLRNLGEGRWQVDGQTVVPPGARPDMYYVPIIFLERPNEKSQRTAVPTIPTFVRITNGRALPPPVIRSISVLGLDPAMNLGTLPLTNSYMVPTNVPFTVEYYVEGRVKAFDMWFDLDIWYQLPTEFGIARGTGSSDSFPAMLKKTVVTPDANGTKVTMTFVLVDQLAGLKIAGIKFRKFYMRTTDFSWVEFEMPLLHDHLVINKRFDHCQVSPQNPCPGLKNVRILNR
jgi:hypothetical protein